MIKAHNLVIGICAHVDAGKTTLSEGLLYLGGSIRKMGRVDTRDAFLDTDEMERARGITIFSKQAQLVSAREYTLLDTPGHADFSPEMERTLQVLDLAVLVISAADGVNAQVKTLWSLLRHYDVPTVIFVNKMDQIESLGEGEERKDAVLLEIQEQLNTNALQLSPYPYVDFADKDHTVGLKSANTNVKGSASTTSAGTKSSASTTSAGAKSSASTTSAGTKSSASITSAGAKDSSSTASAGAKNTVMSANPADAAKQALDSGLIRQALLDYLEDADLQENLALCDEDLLGRVMEGEKVTPADIEMLVAERKLFPVFFGSALKMQGVGELLAGLDLYAPTPVYPEEFSARIFKITRDGRERLTWMKITGGSIAVRKELTYHGRRAGGDTQVEEGDESEGAFAEKITQIRLYSGDRFTPLPEAGPGCVCAVCGLTATFAGQGLGADATENVGLVVPVLTWQILLPQGTDPFKAYKDLCILEEEEPMLQVAYNERKREITACVMGEIQREVLKKIVKERFDLEIAFGRPSIIYKETIAEPVEGVGHFEPLRHYAEVHLLLEPGEPGSGLTIESKCSVDSLARNWQRLVMTHLRERRHKGVLTGSEITDMKITLIGGRAHEKHTEGGDFRQATYRAVRQGLMMARNVLLEPYYNFRLELPQGSLGRALTDLQKMGASFGQPDIENGEAILTGNAPVSALGDYAEQLSAYTKGRGRLLVEMGGYRPCHNMEEVVAEFSYDPDADKRNPTSSVFCAHGAGMIVPWYQVRDYMHVDTGWREGVTSEDGMFRQSGASRSGAVNAESERRYVADGGAGVGAGVTGSAGNNSGSGNGAASGAGASAGTGAGVTGSAGNNSGTGNGAAGVAGASAGATGRAGNNSGTGNGAAGGVGASAGATGSAGNNSGIRNGAAGGVGNNVSPGTSSIYGSATSGQLTNTEAGTSTNGIVEGDGLGEGSAHLQNDATAYYANAGYGAAGMRAGSAAKPAEDTRSFKEREKDIFAAEDELRSIFERTYGPIKSTVGQNANTGPRRVTGTETPKKYRKPKPKPEKEYLLVDGYNIIFAWDELRNLAQGDVKAARDSLMDRLSNYAGFTKKNVICVFDAYKVPGGTEQIYRYHNIDVIFTREAETADQYIEKAAHELTKQYQVTVATSDAIEQIIIYGAGAVRLSARNFESEVVNAEREMQAQYIAQDTDRRQTVGSSVGEEIRKAMAREAGLTDGEDA